MRAGGPAGFVGGIGRRSASTHPSTHSTTARFRRVRVDPWLSHPGIKLTGSAACPALDDRKGARIDGRPGGFHPDTT